MVDLFVLGSFLLLAHLHRTVGEIRGSPKKKKKKKLVGDILSFHIFGHVIIVLNTTKATKDLLEKRGDVYSDRPVVQMMKMRWLVPFARYSEFWCQARKLLDPSFRPGALMAYRPMLQTKMRTLLTRPRASPDEWETHIERRACLGYNLVKLASEFALPGALLGHNNMR
ncbi:hypothetical protein EDB92DRAFT_290801 [Lactarius akahatsu]|uniref:Cytochrome P450 n=1 Tax=Lactarius akahatsu TaxID=416441 RepID=A0AAD4LKS0_9AGAM|nr:hypothetical protein EDB92DRAFT_290801 [Lactarius akahatsu]